LTAKFITGVEKFTLLYSNYQDFFNWNLLLAKNRYVFFNVRKMRAKSQLKRDQGMLIPDMI
jgi:hypothetical protein